MESKNDDFRGLLYNPTLESEVVMLFSMMIPHLKDSFAIEQGDRGIFPDCFALRNGQKVGIEFELFASNFDHEDDDNLTKCNILICWKNDIRNTNRNGIDLLDVKGHEIEIVSLDKVVDDLQKTASLKIIKGGERPAIYRVGEEGFFEQLEDKGRKRYDWIKELYDQVKQSKDFEVKWGGGKTWSTMRFYVKKWDVSPIVVYGNGSIEVIYQGNEAIFPWFELHQETKREFGQLFKNPKQKPWHYIPFETETDLNNIKKALKILAEHSKRFDSVIWHTKS